MSSADSWRMRGIEGVGTEELVYFGALLRMVIILCWFLCGLLKVFPYISP